MTFAVDRKLRPDNPVRGVKTYAVPKRERFLSAAEWAALGQALADSEAAGADPRPVNIIRLLSLTGCRKSEIAGLKWSDIESERGLLVLQDSKTGWKAVPVGAAALEVLSKIDRGDGPYVFPDPFHPEKPFGQLFWFWSGLRKRAGLEGLRIHDLRHSFASTGLAAGQGLAVLSKLLGHADIHMTQRYAHLAADPLKAAADRIASNIEGAMAGRSAEIHSIGGGSKGAA
jgi:integrase